MLAGFGLDSYTFGRIDRPAANIVFVRLSYHSRR